MFAAKQSDLTPAQRAHSRRVLWPRGRMAA
jgi:hypothetical protein